MQVADTQIVVEIVTEEDTETEELAEETLSPTETGNEENESTKTMPAMATATTGTKEEHGAVTEATTLEGVVVVDSAPTTLEAGSTATKEEDSTTVTTQTTMTAITSEAITGVTTEETTSAIAIREATSGEVAAILQTIVSHSKMEMAKLETPATTAWITVVVVDMVEGATARTSTKRAGNNEGMWLRLGCCFWVLLFSRCLIVLVYVRIPV